MKPTREQVIEMAESSGVTIYSQYRDETVSLLERLVHAAYKRGVEDSASMFYQPHTEFFGDEIQLAIRALLEE